MADDVSAWIWEAMCEARNLLFKDDATLTMQDVDQNVLKTFDCDWSLIPPQASNQDLTDWVLRLRQDDSLTQEMMDRFAFVIVEDKRFERVWMNPVRQISSVWIAHVRQVGAV